MSKRSLFTTLIVSLLLLSSSSSHAAMIWGITTLSKNVIFDKYESEMAADNVQDALDEVDARLDYFENQQNPTSYNHSYAPAPMHFTQRRTNALFNTNGIKEACKGVKTPDPNCTRAGLQKTKTIGDSLQVATLSANESHMRFDVLYAGGDTDSVGHHIKVYNTGGAQTLGDEGTQVLRGASYDFNTTVFARGTITSDTGDVFNPVRLTIDGDLSRHETMFIGERKLVVFTSQKQSISLAEKLPPGTHALKTYASGGYGAHYKNTPPYNWQLAEGQVNSTGVTRGWCFASEDSKYTDTQNQETRHWLYITDVDEATNTIKTEWFAQGYNREYPFGYFAALGENTALVAPCVKIQQINFDNGGEVATSLNVVKESTFAASNEGFEVSSYGVHKNVGVKVLLGNALGKNGVAFNALNTVGPRNGRYQLESALQVGYASPLPIKDTILDGHFHAFESGLRCFPGGCQYGIDYDYVNGAGPGKTGVLAAIKPPRTESNWTTPYYIDVIRVSRHSEHDLELTKDQGWRINGKPIVSVKGTPNNGDVLTFDASQNAWVPKPAEEVCTTTP